MNKLFAYFLVLLFTSTFANAAIDTSHKSLRVVIYNDPNAPLISSILNDVWHTNANAMNLSTLITTTSDKKTALNLLSNDKADVAVGPFRYMDAGNNYFINSYVDVTNGVIIIEKAMKINFWQKMEIIVPIIFNKSVFIVLSVLTLFTLIIWLVERTGPQSEFARSPKLGLWHAFWFQVTTFTTVGYGDYLPKRVLGQGLTIIMMFANLFLLTTFTASFTSELTSRQINQGQLSTLTQLHEQRVAYLATEPAMADQIERYYAIPVPCSSLDDLVAKVEARDVSAAFANRLNLRDYLRKHSHPQIKLTQFSLKEGDYLFLVNPRLRLTVPINMSLYKLNASGKIDDIVNQYVGKDAAAKLTS